LRTSGVEVGREERGGPWFVVAAVAALVGQVAIVPNLAAYVGLACPLPLYFSLQLFW